VVIRAQVIAMFDNENRDSERGQVGIGTLIVFIAMVLVAAIAAGVLINTAGFLQSQSEETGQQSSEQVTNRLQIQTATGLVTGNDNENAIGAVEMIATKAPGAQDIDLEGVTVQWVDDSGTYDVVHDNVFDSQDGAFDHIAVKDEDGSLDDGTNDGSATTDTAPVINSPDDRARLVFDIGESDDGTLGGSGTTLFSVSSDDVHNYRTEGGSPAGLDEGETAQLRITTQSGATSTVRLTVPESLSGKSAASL
jgi:flagellin FlaB